MTIARKRIALVFGTRPEAIKLAPIVRECEARGIPLIKISTGQHKSMLWQALEFFEVPVDHDLGAMREGQTLPELLARILTDVETVLKRERPDVVVVHGDTATALGSGLSAYLSQIDVAHVEAGLRTFDHANPFPEEGNRVLLSRLARWHFAPTERARMNLESEGIDASRIHVTGNTIVDALKWARRKFAARDPAHVTRIAQRLKVGPEAFGRMALITSHRRENYGRGLDQICAAICALEHSRPDLTIVWPVHLNPMVRRQVEALLDNCAPRVIRTEPLDYEDMLFLLDRCAFILTDSGGIQEEAAFFQKPVLIMREATERPEIVESGCGILVGTDTSLITSSVETLLDDPDVYRRMCSAPNPFGDGRAAERIVEVLS